MTTGNGPAACIVCGSCDLRPFGQVLVKCQVCGHIMAAVDPETLHFQEIYGDSYFTGDEYADYLRDRPVFQRQFEDRLREVLPFVQQGDLIEIGSAYGFFLDVAGRIFCARGFDICPGPVRFARERLGVNAACEDFTKNSAPAACADAVVMWDTVEHLPRPDLTLSAAARALRPGGYLFLTTGDIGSLPARWRGSKWRMIHPPTHLQYFTQSSIRRLLANSGLQTVRIRYVGTRRSLSQVAFSLLQLNKKTPSRLYGLISRSHLGRLSFVLNTRDIMLVVARKS